MTLFKEDAKGVTFQVMVQPKARANRIIGDRGGGLKVQIAAPPHRGEANQECVKFLAEVFRLPKKSIEIVSGGKQRIKKIRVVNVSAQVLKASLKKCLEPSKIP